MVHDTCPPPGVNLPHFSRSWLACHDIFWGSMTVMTEATRRLTGALTTLNQLNQCPSFTMSSFPLPLCPAFILSMSPGVSLPSSFKAMSTASSQAFTPKLSNETKICPLLGDWELWQWRSHGYMVTWKAWLHSEASCSWHRQVAECGETAKGWSSTVTLNTSSGQG